MKKIHNILSFFLLLSYFSFAQKIIYVNNANSTANQNGTSWATAYSNLSTALSLAVPNDEIWIAKGSYFATNDNDRKKSFVLKKGIRLYGGFVGNENNKSQRDYLKNISILDGNIGTKSDSLDNSYNILICDNTDSTSATTIK